MRKITYDKTYLVIDLKSFFASVECVLRGLNSMEAKLVVADPSRGDGAICLAVSPMMKALGVKNRCRIFEIPEGLDYITALPRMQKYIDFAAEIYGVYLKYVGKEDILVYSIDECFLDITSYLTIYNTDAFTLAKRIVKDVFETTGIRATCGIGPNMFLSKIALDLYAKHSRDFIGFINEEIFETQTIEHTPITDIWNIGHGIAKRLAKYGCFDLKGIRKIPEEKLYKEFGVNAEFLIDHAYGYEPCTIKDVHNYKSKAKSLTNGQILFEDYTYDEARLVVKEMVEITSLELFDKGLVTNNLSLYIGYSKDEHKPLAKSMKIATYTNSYQKIVEYFLDMYDKNISKSHKIRRITISLNNVVSDIYETFDIFDDVEKIEKEKIVQTTINDIKKKYGKNSILKAMNIQDKSTTTKRNKLIGGHNAE